MDILNEIRELEDAIEEWESDPDLHLSDRGYQDMLMRLEDLKEEYSKND